MTPGCTKPQPAIIIFGAAVRRDGKPSETLRRRVEAAFAFGALLPAPLYMPTGGVGQFGASEASVMAELLRARGVPESSIVMEDTATDTLSSVRACAALLRERGHRGRVYVATSAYHVLRCMLLLRLAGVKARMSPPPRVPAATRLGTRWYWRLREIAAIPVDVALAIWLRARQKV